VVDELFFLRTDDVPPSDALKVLVMSPTERKVVDKLKNRMPIVLSASRGVGKTILLRKAEDELAKSLATDRILPVFVKFRDSTLIAAKQGDAFLVWMVAKIRDEIARAATAYGLMAPDNSVIRAIRGQSGPGSTMEELETKLTTAYRRKSGGEEIVESLDPDDVHYLVERLCAQASIRRIVLLVDEAIHAFQPNQQRQFFTLMRNLSGPYITIKAAVYPGISTFGESFHPNHDATFIGLDRDILDKGYLEAMRSIVLAKDPGLRRTIEDNPAVFDTLAYAATGNPRILVKTISEDRRLRRNALPDTLRQQYQEAILSEHTDLADKYSGHAALIHWGRSFLEDHVLRRIYQRNNTKKETTSHIWIHKDAPATVHRALQLLCYSGVLRQEDKNTRGPRNGIGTRYLVNLGCHLVLDSDPIEYCERVTSKLSRRAAVDFHADEEKFDEIKGHDLGTVDQGDANAALRARLDSRATRLDLTDFQRKTIAQLDLQTIGDVLLADESTFRKVHGVGPVYARRIHNAAQAAVLEYLSG
jgi:hypothetical protein